ncbi:uncharacterized protein B0I36DRAFT_350990 [Microdochium trichocladiopsis]|uniref:Uncharacterized protein n=1 Tax=Microdochium trichocladiopsis TaxID=1682393 RepID=A0A9P8Y0C0_9PEZI|nr:uncharacterized protein B0I36DRAFT_350990 [Microdochium trichocladiopsis]KAH7027463.1 hypothetical protein B0I36DRAFT_350990 [Microdochium trichocladiopsis]
MAMPTRCSQEPHDFFLEDTGETLIPARLRSDSGTLAGAIREQPEGGLDEILQQAVRNQPAPDQPAGQLLQSGTKQDKRKGIGFPRASKAHDTTTLNVDVSDLVETSPIVVIVGPPPGITSIPAPPTHNYNPTRHSPSGLCQSTLSRFPIRDSETSAWNLLGSCLETTHALRRDPEAASAYRQRRTSALSVAGQLSWVHRPAQSET